MKNQINLWDKFSENVTTDKIEEFEFDLFRAIEILRQLWYAGNLVTDPKTPITKQLNCD